MKIIRVLSIVIIVLGAIGIIMGGIFVGERMADVTILVLNDLFFESMRHHVSAFAKSIYLTYDRADNRAKN